MIRNFLKTSVRFLMRNKTYSLLNFLCLSFGLTCAIIAALYILNIFSYDKFHKNYDRLYQVEAIVTFFNGDRFLKEPLSASLVGDLNANVPELEAITRVVPGGLNFINGDRSFTEQGIYADDNFLNIFSFPMASGGNSNEISELNTIVISERMALKLFETTDCIGKTAVIKDNEKQEAYKITGVIRNVPSQSLLQFDFIIPLSKFLAGNPLANETGASSCHYWALVSENSDITKINNKIRDLIKNQETTLNQELFLFPLREKILYNYAGGRRVWDGMQYVVIFGCIAFAILLIACFNFINLAVAMNIKRYREAGIKKVAGASRSAIIFQYLTETFVITAISLLFSIILVRLLIPLVNSQFNAGISFTIADFRVVLILAAIMISTGILSGLLPALYLSSSNPLSVLKGEIVKSHSYSFFRQSLIVFQFVIPVVLIIFMMIIKTQDNYMRDYDMGFQNDKLIVIGNTRNLEAHEGSLKTDLLSIPGIEAVSFTNCIPARGTTVSNEVTWTGKDASEKLHFWCINTDYQYNTAINLNITDGRYFSYSFPSDSASFLINDIAAGVFEYDEPLGKTISVDGKEGTIIGVFKDFHSVDLAGPFAPTIISLSPASRNNILIRFSSGTYSSLKDKIRDVYIRYEPEMSFAPTLYKDLPSYSNLDMSSDLAGTACFIALLLACLGLSGLASFSASSRTKEIGIRKTNGATTLSVIKLLGIGYTRWLIISFIIALPIAFLLGRIFLMRFYFHSPLPLWVFVAGVCITYTIALLSVSVQSWRAASRNPVEALRYE
ncbi:MAG: putative ABC transporter permease YknZ [Bacteroidetes bacterium ADurb.Bin145]|nr:MAG: putative ABC transporter permease YknZ [Bacteroidetes bacterium ADurb.Bin145]